MRTFDQFEQGILQILIQWHQENQRLNFISLLDEFIENMGIRINIVNNQVELLFDRNIYGEGNEGAMNLLNHVQALVDTIVRIIILIQYLEREGLIFLFAEANPAAYPNEHTRIANDLPPIIYAIGDSHVCGLIVHYFPRTIYISQQIVDYVERGYRTIEDDRHAETIKLANKRVITGYIGIGISIFIGLFSIFFSCYNIRINSERTEKSNENFVKDTLIKNNHFSFIRDKINSIDSNIIILNTKIKTNIELKKTTNK